MNLLSEAAAIDDVALAAAKLANALGIEDATVGSRVLPSDYRWRKFSSAGRLDAIGAWLRAECYELINLQPGRDPKDTVGTRD